jgi:uncharacterized protein
MTKMIFVNLPVADLARSQSFYEAVGFTNNPQFSNDQASSMVWSEAIHVMLLTHDFWKTFTSKIIPDAATTAQVMLCLSLGSRDAIDPLVETARAAGSKVDPTPTQDMPFMYGRSFEDLDGHIWEIMWMDVEAFGSTEPSAAPM